jgi:NAD+ kinase
MKIKLVGKNLDDIRPVLYEYGLSECSGSENVELIVTYGGDGSLLGAQRDYPDIPKLPLRDTATAPTCPAHPARKVIEKFLNGSMVLQRIPVLEAVCRGETILGINDLVIHSREYVSALRYRVRIDGELYAREIVGDGVCFSGVHGSTAYYRSITRGIFRVGVGLAFCNSTEVVDHLVLPEKSLISVEILRGPGVLTADNDPRKIDLEVGDAVDFRQTEKFAGIWDLDGFMCPDCRTLRHRRK